MSISSGPRVAICGAGIAGCAAAWQLAQCDVVADVVIVDERSPLSLTSDKSTECYRNWWPGAGGAMTALTNRSIELMEALATAHDDRFALNRRGYLFATANASTAAGLEREARACCAGGAGELRVHDERADGYEGARASGWTEASDGADLLYGEALLARHFPWLNRDAVAAMHVRRAGWLSAQQLGMLLLELARARGARLLRGRLASVDAPGGRVRSIAVDTAGASERIAVDVVVNAAGPYAGAVGQLLGAALPIACEGHVKVSFEDVLGAVPRDAPLMLWCDPVTLPFSADERAALTGSDEGEALLSPFPAGVHGRPEGAGNQVLLYWTYDRRSLDSPRYPLEWDPAYPEIATRGMSVMIPALARYAQRMPKPYVDGGYYAKTPDNRPLIGPCGLEGAFAMTAFSGYGIMAAAAAAELLTSHIAGAALPAWAHALAPARFDDPGYAAGLDEDAGQL